VRSIPVNNVRINTPVASQPLSIRLGSDAGVPTNTKVWVQATDSNSLTSPWISATVDV
jgi:hypothetical protein